MKTQLYKQQIAKQNHHILFAVYHLGKGILWRTQLARYMQYFYEMSDTSLSRALGELVDADIIQIHRHLNRRIIRIKKYGIYYLTRLTREGTPSITFKMSKALNSAYINGVLLYLLLNKEQATTLEEFVKVVKTNTTFLSKQKQSHHILQYMLQKAPHQENWHSINRHYKNLEAIKIQSTANLRGLTVPESNTESTTEFNLNSMQTRNVFIGGWHHSRNRTESDNLEIIQGPVIYVLDINRKYHNLKKLGNLFKEIREYMTELFSYLPGLTIRYKLIVEDAHAELYYRNSKQFEKLLETHGLDEVEILNLNILNEVFAGITILR